MNWGILIIVAIAVTLLVTWLVMRNRQDREKVENQLNQDYHKTKDEEGDVDADPPVK